MLRSCCLHVFPSTRSLLPCHLPELQSTTIIHKMSLTNRSLQQLLRRTIQQCAPRRTLVTQSRPRFAQAATAPATKNIPVPPSSTQDSESSVQPLPELTEQDPTHIDWTNSFHGLSVEPFAKDAADVLLAPLDPEDIEIKPDGIIYLPEIKYRRILNKAFGPGGWGLAPRGETIVTEKAVTREYALLAHGR